MRVEQTFTVSSSPDSVFDYLTQPANLCDWQKQSQSFSEFAAYMGSDKKGPGLSGRELNTGGEPQRVQALSVTGNIFSVFVLLPLTLMIWFYFIRPAHRRRYRRAIAELPKWQLRPQ